MVKIDLITGFLGSGKTTFLLKYAKYLIDKGERIAILENDYGAVNVDTMLVESLNCDVFMIAGGCDIDCHKRRFKTKLISMAMSGYDRVIVEPSGIYDPDEFFDTLYEEPLDNWYEINSVISIVDANIDLNLTKESRYILMSEISSSGAILFSKNNLFHRPYDETLDYIKKAFDEFKCDSKLPNAICNEPTDADFESLSRCGYKTSSHIKLNVMDENQYDSVYFMDLKLNRERVLALSKELFNGNYGNVIRIKGFVKEDNWYEINITKALSSIKEISNGQDVIIIIGEDINNDLINSLVKE